MGRNSGGVTSGGTPKGRGDVNYKGKITGLRDLVTVKDKAVYKELKEGISRYHTMLGVRQKDVRVGTMENGVLGVHATIGGKSGQIILNSKYFDLPKAKIETMQRQGMKDGWHTKTNHLDSANAKAATPAVKKLYNAWTRDRKKKGYGQYAKTNINEFWAETSAKAVRGDQDRYTRAVRGIIKKYKL